MLTSNFSDSNIDDGSSQIDNTDNSNINISDINIMGKHFKESEIWDYFTKVEWGSNINTKSARCTISKCKHKLFLCGKKGTTRPL